MTHHRKINLSMFRGGEDDEEDDLVIAPKRQVELTDLKSRTFNHGNMKKTKKDLEKEAEEKKRLEEEKAQALVMAEYEEAFERPQYGLPGGGVRGSGFVRAGGAPLQQNHNQIPARGWNPPSGPSGSRGPPAGPSATGYSRGFGRISPPPQASSVPKPRGKRQMDAFLEEIKGNQETREQRLGKMAKLEGSSVTALAAWENSQGQGRPQLNDSESTNLFIANLPHNVTEDSLGRFFAKFGPVGTVKIMWPRGEDMMHANRRGQTGFTGFVAYMKRPHAEKAVSELDGLNWGGNVIKVAFSKAMPVPTRAIYDLGNGAGGRSRSPSPKRGQRRDDHRSYPGAGGSAKRSRSPSPRRSRSMSRSPTPPPKRSAAKERWLAKVPLDEEDFIHSIARTVKDHGNKYEENLKAKQRSNPEYAFMFDDNIPGYHVYKLALNKRHRVPTPPPEEFDDEGYASMYSSDSAEDSERERTSKGRIGKIARKRFESMLRSMSGKRVEIARAMEFALTRAEAADEVAELVCQSLQLDSTPVPRKIARLHLVSDILHNSASPLPNVWKYRLAFEKGLPAVFAHLNIVCQSLDAYSGKISADVFKAQVHAVLDVWERWIVYTQDVAGVFRARLEGKQTQLEQEETAREAQAAEKKTARTEVDQLSGFKSSGFKSSFKPAAAVVEPVASVGDIEGDVDGEEIDGEVDGEMMVDVDVDAAPMDDVDGEEMEDVDGQALDDDLDGEAL